MKWNRPLALSRAQVREVDRIAIEDFGIPGVVLMENAGRSMAEIVGHLAKGLIVICVGKGNNGGDGLVMARHLFNAEKNVRVLLFANPDEVQGDAKINLDIVTNMEIPLHAMQNASEIQVQALIKEADWLVDALLGTGAQGEVREPFATAIDCMNESQKNIFAVDIPSGMDCDSGEPQGTAIHAKMTASCVALKKGFASEHAHQYVGEDVYLIDIGVPRSVIEQLATTDADETF